MYVTQLFKSDNHSPVMDLEDNGMMIQYNNSNS